MTLRRTLPVLAALALAACAGSLGPAASLPPDAVMGAGDPLRSAITSTSLAFASPSRLAGRPAEAARAIAQMEYLAVEIPGNPRLVGDSPTLDAQLRSARQEWRAALGIPPEVPAQAVIDSLYAAARALGTGQPATAASVLPAVAFPGGGQATLARLGDLPSLPHTNAAAVAATETLRGQEGPTSGRL